MKKLQITYLLAIRFLKRFWRRVILSIFFIILLAIFILFFSPQFLRTTTVTQGLVGTYNQTSLPTVVTNLLSEPLIVIDQNGKPQPHLLSSWESNEDSTFYVLKLKPNLYWTDGTKLVSSDIVIDLTESEISYPDETTIQIKLNNAYSLLPNLLTKPVLKKDTLIGMGRYKVTRSNTSHGVITRLDLSSAKDSQLPQVTFRFYLDEHIAWDAYQLGEVNSLLGVTELTRLAGTDTLKKLSSFNKLVAVFYNTKDNLLSDKNLRKALSSSITTTDQEERAITSIPSYSWAFNKDLKTSGRDLNIAKSYLTKVQGNKGPITLTVIPSLATLGEKVIKDWKDIGVSGVLRVESGNPQNFQALLTSESIPSDPDQYLLWHSTQTQTNLSKYSSVRVDRDLEDGRKTNDINLRKERYLDFQRVLQDDVPAAFLYFPKTNVVYRSKIEPQLNKILPLQIISN